MYEREHPALFSERYEAIIAVLAARDSVAAAAAMTERIGTGLAAVPASFAADGDKPIDGSAAS